MHPIQQLALQWDAKAEADRQDARSGNYPSISDALLAHSATRRNCAWELRRVLSALEKENPSEDGHLRLAHTDSESI